MPQTFCLSAGGSGGRVRSQHVPTPCSEVLLLSELYPPTVGGSAVLFENFYTRLDPPLSVRVLTDGPGGLHYQAGLPVTSVPMGGPDWGVLRPRSLRRHLRVARALRSLSPRPDLVHCGRALPEGLSAKIAGLPYVCWTHGEELGFASSSRELTWLMRKTYAAAKGVLANSHNSARLLESDWRVPAERITVVHPGVDTARFHPAADPAGWRRQFAPAGEILFLSVGRLQRRKGHDLVLRAMAQLTDLPIRYLIAGDGPTRAALAEQVRQAGLDNRVAFLGVVSEDALPGLYAASDVFVLPNRQDGVDFEGFGIVFLEAAAAGRPTIGGRSGGVAEAVADGETGLLVDGREAGAVAEAMRRLALDPGLRARLGQCGRERVLRQFTWEAGATRLAYAHRQWCGDRPAD
jgi:phosphatidyl-myo-inositol dimannoside synthase